MHALYVNTALCVNAFTHAHGLELLARTCVRVCNACNSYTRMFVCAFVCVCVYNGGGPHHVKTPNFNYYIYILHQKLTYQRQCRSLVSINITRL